MQDNSNIVVAENVLPETVSENNTTEVENELVEQSTISEQTSEKEADSMISDDEPIKNSGDIQYDNETTNFLTVRYNHETRELSEVEARNLAQKGMQAEPIMEDLRYLAAQEGSKSVKEFIDSLKSIAEKSRLENIRSQLVDEDNEELLSSILSLQNEKIKKEAGVIEQNELKTTADDINNENVRLANEFIALKTEFPEIKEIKDVPNEVFNIAVKNKVSLLDAHLRFMHAENIKIKQAKESAALASNSSTGSMSSVNYDTSTSALDAMRKGVWQGLRRN